MSVNEIMNYLSFIMALIALLLSIYTYLKQKRYARPLVDFFEEEKEEGNSILNRIHIVNHGNGIAYNVRLKYTHNAVQLSASELNLVNTLMPNGGEVVKEYNKLNNNNIYNRRYICILYDDYIGNHYLSRYDTGELKVVRCRATN